MSKEPPPRSDDYQPERRNAQTDEQSSKHRPGEFDAQNPARQVDQPAGTPRK